MRASAQARCARSPPEPPPPPLLPRAQNYDQLVKITKVLGTDALYAYLAKYGLTLDGHFDGLISRQAPRAFQKFITPENAHLATPDAIDFISKRARGAGARAGESKRCARPRAHPPPPPHPHALATPAVLKYDHAERMTAREALAHPWLASAREAAASKAAAAAGFGGEADA